MSFAPPVKDVNKMANGEAAMYGDDRKLIVTFSKEPVLQGYESEKAGRQIYKDMDYIVIITPGGKSDNRRVVKMADDERGPSDPHRFPIQWAQYQNEQHQVSDGLPLEQWPPLGKSHVFGFKAAQIFTVEQLSVLPDSALQAIPVMDARRYRDLAKTYLERADAGAPIAALTQENATLKQEMEIMRRQIEELAANQKMKPGRKPNKENDDAET
jgi:hypothetical protein